MPFNIITEFMSTLSPAYFDFFKQLEKNNNSDWFHAHKADYEKSVKEPFEKLVGAIIITLQQKDSALQVTPKECIFRINRDVRFSKDKQPYKLHMAAYIATGGKKGNSPKGMYFQVGGKEGMLGGGVYDPDKETLYRIRWHLKENGKSWKKAIESPNFIKYFGEIQGEKNKILQPEFKLAGEELPWLFNKQFYYMATTDTDFWQSKDLLKNILKYYEAAYPVGSWLAEAQASK